MPNGFGVLSLRFIPSLFTGHNSTGVVNNHAALSTIYLYRPASHACRGFTTLENYNGKGQRILYTIEVGSANVKKLMFSTVRSQKIVPGKLRAAHMYFISCR
jgi:hypothetical protein